MQTGRLIPKFLLTSRENKISVFRTWEYRKIACRIERQFLAYVASGWITLVILFDIGLVVFLGQRIPCTIHALSNYYVPAIDSDENGNVRM